MVDSVYVPQRGDIVKLNCGTAKPISVDLIKRIQIFIKSGMSFADIAETLDSEVTPKGHEQMDYRPFLVISPLAYNRMASLVVVCPITNSIKGLSFEVPLSEGLNTQGVVLADQVKSLSWTTRKVQFVETVAEDLVEEVQARIEALIL
ncbi:type II toxin-antitoxin system PemK/MazF family toxin [Anabaena cylindrica UHCC 0172]|uniref:type II toxin-antitoxin system PemK/MazF family toxin n=1 Tax=Anabaena cylindrica TaxID=1165 RepID=UPI002B2092BC|nr:type II toxin-antitoxin system PemK/MazF family toxin [Anabaena cylindrica]MEA5551706.1 type II toxin-antitoxin system PemK/MazF family toxin [Anabaena cylindrica UHCC 0172]